MPRFGCVPSAMPRGGRETAALAGHLRLHPGARLERGVTKRRAAQTLWQRRRAATGSAPRRPAGCPPLPARWQETSPAKTGGARRRPAHRRRSGRPPRRRRDQQRDLLPSPAMAMQGRTWGKAHLHRPRRARHFLLDPGIPCRSHPPPPRCGQPDLVEARCHYPPPPPLSGGSFPLVNETPARRPLVRGCLASILFHFRPGRLAATRPAPPGPPRCPPRHRRGRHARRPPPMDVSRETKGGRKISRHAPAHRAARAPPHPVRAAGPLVHLERTAVPSPPPPTVHPATRHSPQEGGGCSATRAGSPSSGRGGGSAGVPAPLPAAFPSWQVGPRAAGALPDHAGSPADGRPSGPARPPPPPPLRNAPETAA